MLMIDQAQQKRLVKNSYSALAQFTIPCRPKLGSET